MLVWILVIALYIALTVIAIIHAEQEHQALSDGYSSVTSKILRLVFILLLGWFTTIMLGITIVGALLSAVLMEKVCEYDYSADGFFIGYKRWWNRIVKLWKLIWSWRKKDVGTNGSSTTDDGRDRASVQETVESGNANPPNVGGEDKAVECMSESNGTDNDGQDDSSGNRQD